jgi:hypothetical protein
VIVKVLDVCGRSALFSLPRPMFRDKHLDHGDGQKYTVDTVDEG